MSGKYFILVSVVEKVVSTNFLFNSLLKSAERKYEIQMENCGLQVAIIMEYL